MQATPQSVKMGGRGHDHWGLARGRQHPAVILPWPFRPPPPLPMTLLIVRGKSNSVLTLFCASYKLCVTGSVLGLLKETPTKHVCKLALKRKRIVNIFICRLCVAVHF